MSDCGRWGARKILIIIRWLGTGQVIKVAVQFVKFEWLKVKFRWLRGQRSVQHPTENQFYGSLKGYVPRLARHEDFGRIFEGVSSSSAESVHARDWSKQHQGRRGTYMATSADRMHTVTGLGARSSNQQGGRGVSESCLWPTMQYWGFLGGAREFKARNTAIKHTFFLGPGFRRPNLITGLSGWRTPD